MNCSSAISFSIPKRFHMSSLKLTVSPVSFRLNTLIHIHYTDKRGKTSQRYVKRVEKHLIDIDGDWVNVQCCYEDGKPMTEVRKDGTEKEMHRRLNLSNVSFTREDCLAMGYCPQCKMPLSDGCEYSETTDDCVNS